MTLREEMSDLFAELQTIPQELGFRERVVTLRNYTVTGANPARQIPGARTAVDTALSPTPKVADGGFALIQWAQAHGGTIEEGDLLVTAIPRTYSESALKDAEEWVVDGHAYRLIRLVRKSVSWEAFLRRARG